MVAMSTVNVNSSAIEVSFYRVGQKNGTKFLYANNFIKY